MNKLIKNYIYNLIYQIVLIVVPLVTAPYITRTLTPSSVGVYDYINSVASIIATFGLLGLQSYGYRQIAYCREDKNTVNREFSAIFTLRIALLFIVSIVYFPVVSFSVYRKYFYIQYILIFAQFVDLSWVFIGYENMGVVSLRNLLAKVLTVIGIFLFIKSDDDLVFYFLVFDLATLVTIVSLFPMSRKLVTLQKISAHDVMSHLLPAIKLFIPQIAVTLYLQIDKIMIAKLVSEAEVAYYSYAEKLINMPIAIITALGTVMMPRLANCFAKGDEESVSKYLKLTIEFAMFIAIPLAVGMATVIDGIIPWYLGANYSATIGVVMLLSPICILNALLNIFGAQYLTALNKTKILTVSYYGAAVVNLILNAILIPIYGCYGAAIATVMCSACSLAIQCIYVRRHEKLRGVWLQILKNITASFAMFCVLIVIKTKMPISVLTSFIQIVVGVFVYFVMSLLIRDNILRIIMERIKRYLVKSLL